MFTIDINKRLVQELEYLNQRALPHANKRFVNDAAFAVMREARQGVRETMTLRNKWTERSIQVERSRTLDMRRQGATVGSTEEYMLDQEFGTTKIKGGREGVILPTSWSAGQQGAKPRSRLPRRPNAMKNIKLKHRKLRGVGKRQKNALLVKQAVETKDRFIFMDLGRRKGIFKVLGGRKKNPSGHVRGARVKMVHDMTRASVRVPPTPWLNPAIDRVLPKMPRMFTKRLIEQIRKNRR